MGIDIGGTTIKGGRICGNRIVEQVALDTRADEGGEVTINQVREMIRQLRNDDTTAIGIGVPSVVDRMKGVVYNVQNIRDWEEVHLKAILEMDFHLPVHLGNDANCFAYGEKIFGKGSGFEHFVGITLGTGVGGVASSSSIVCLRMPTADRVSLGRFPISIPSWKNIVGAASSHALRGRRLMRWHLLHWKGISDRWRYGTSTASTWQRW